jgi:hypothetical protein
MHAALQDGRAPPTPARALPLKSNPPLQLAPHNSLPAAAVARRARRGGARARTHEAAHEDVREQLGQHQVRVAQVEADLPHRQHAHLRARGRHPVATAPSSAPTAQPQHLAAGPRHRLSQRRAPPGPMRCAATPGPLCTRHAPRPARRTGAATGTGCGGAGAPGTKRAGPAAGGRRRSRLRSSRRWARGPRRRAPPPPARSAGLARALSHSAPTDAPATPPNPRLPRRAGGSAQAAAPLAAPRPAPGAPDDEATRALACAHAGSNLNLAKRSRCRPRRAHPRCWRRGRQHARAPHGRCSPCGGRPRAG